MQRLGYIDIAKGILIICVALGHIPYAIELLGKDYPFVCFPINETSFLYVGVYMQAFFLLSGYTSHFNKPFFQFLFHNAKSILLPCFTLGTIAQILNYILIGNYSQDLYPKGIITFYFCDNLWFLWALFVARIIYWTVCRFQDKHLCRGITMTLILLLGIFLDQEFKNNTSVFCANYCFYRTAMCLGIFLWIGDLMKTHKPSYKAILALGLTYIPLIIASKFIPIIRPVSFAGAGGGMSYWQIPQYIIFVITGALLLVYVSRKIERCSFLQYYGRNTLVIYGTNIPVLLIMIKILQLLFTPNGKINSMIFLCLMLISYFIGQKLLVYAFNKKPLNLIIGK